MLRASETEGVGDNMEKRFISQGNKVLTEDGSRMKKDMQRGRQNTVNSLQSQELHS